MVVMMMVIMVIMTHFFKQFHKYASAKHCYDYNASMVLIAVITIIVKFSRMGKRKEKDFDYKPGPTHNYGRSTYEKKSQSTKAQLQGRK